MANSWLQFEIGKDSGLGYTDLSDPGNVIRENVTGKRYIVDTEFKSFDFPLPYHLKKLLEYAAKRFRYLNKMSGNNVDYEIALDS